MNLHLLRFGPHDHEHFRFEGTPDRILVATGKTNVSVYKNTGVDLNGLGQYVYQDTVRHSLNQLVKPIYFD